MKNNDLMLKISFFVNLAIFFCLFYITDRKYFLALSIFGNLCSVGIIILLYKTKGKVIVNKSKITNAVGIINSIVVIVLGYKFLIIKPISDYLFSNFLISSFIVFLVVIFVAVFWTRLLKKDTKD